MLRKRLLTISLLLPLVAISAAAQAGTTISDRRYWPSEVGPSAYGANSSQNELSSAFAFDRRAPRSQAATKVNDGKGKYVCRYQGGPKSPMSCTKEQ